jgi:hypothetical protein
MTESDMRQLVVRALAGLDPVSVENPAHPGTPDVNHTGGWLELKRVDAWPARPGSPLRLPHFTPQQRVWLRRRCASRPRGACLLLRVDGKTGGPVRHESVVVDLVAPRRHTAEWLLFAGDAAAEHVGNVNRDRLREIAIGIWSPTLVASQLRTLLSP